MESGQGALGGKEVRNVVLPERGVRDLGYAIRVRSDGQKLRERDKVAESETSKNNVKGCCQSIPTNRYILFQSIYSSEWILESFDKSFLLRLLS